MTKKEMLEVELDLMDRFTSKDFSDVKTIEDFEYKLMEIYREIYHILQEEKNKLKLSKKLLTNNKKYDIINYQIKKGNLRKWEKSKNANVLFVVKNLYFWMNSALIDMSFGVMNVKLI